MYLVLRNFSLVSDNAGESHIESICSHPGDIGGMCIKCGQKVDNESGVKVSYIHKVPSYS